MAQRKLQAEIDKTLKQVAVGVETFESTFEKLQHATNATQKDKVETDLKTQIKKLQRIRDQIKNWISSSEIKDKTALVDHRKLIETQMERFKALEKEMKMKAFSKEGLIAQSRLDPAEKAKREIIDWIGNTNDELARQIELTEAEAETITTGKKKKGGNERLEELETLNERRQWHIHRLEMVQRMLENGQLQTDQVEAIQEDVKYFVESNMEEDFEEDEGIYDELNLVDEEDYIGDGHGDEASNLDSASVADTVDTAPLPQPKTPAKEEDKVKKATPSSRSLSMSQTGPGPAMEDPPSPISGKKQPIRKNTADKATPDQPKPESPVAPTATVGTPTTKTLPPIRYAAAAAAAVASQTPAMPTVPAPVPADEKKDEVERPAQTSVPPVPTESPNKEAESNGNSIAPPPPPGLSKSPAPLQPSSAVASPTSSTAPPLPSFGTASVSGPSPPPGVAPPGYPAPVSAQSQTRAQAPAPTQAQAVASPVQPLAPTAQPPQRGQIGQMGPLGEIRAPSLSAQPSASGSRMTSPLPVGSNQGGVMGGLMHSFDMAKESSERRTSDINELNTALDTSYLNAPQLQDSEPPKYYHPKTPIKTPSYYPQSRAPILEDRRVFQRMDIDQLFFIFYYMTGSYEQWLAAQELKRQSWRFHKQYLTWFQRAHNPQAVTADYEQGGYFYFDWENSWCQRKKSDFRFEYRWLSDD